MHLQVGENAFAYVVEHKDELCCSDWIKMYEGTQQECYRAVGYLDGTESREKRIEELEESNKEWQRACEAKSDTNSQFIEQLANKVEKIAKLEKENAELKEKLKNQKADYETYYKSCYNAQKKAEEQITKAKVALRNVIDYLGQFCSDYPDCVIEVEQFLKK